MLPQYVSCDECDQQATVRGYGRIEYDWPDPARPDPGQSEADAPPTTPQVRAVRLTVDCPHCGLRVQDHFPNGIRPASHPAAQRALIDRLQAVSAALRSPFPSTGPTVG